MGWYVVTKVIKGRPYLYRQRTWREGSRVRTESHYLGPAGSVVVAAEPGEAGEATVNPAQVSTSGIGSQAIIAMRERLLDPTAAAPRWVAPWKSGEGRRLRRIAVLEAVLVRHAVTTLTTRRGAYYSARKDVIYLPARKSYGGTLGNSAEQNYYHTMLHELAHWTGTRDRTGRFYRAGNLALDANRGKEELVAELTALTLLEHLGHPMPDLAIHACYFQNWLSVACIDDDNSYAETLDYATREAEKAANFILSEPVNTTEKGNSNG